MLVTLASPGHSVIANRAARMIICVHCPPAGLPNARPMHAEVHNLSAFRCGQLFIGLAGFLYVEGDGYPEGGMPSDGVIESQLVWSRDGVQWYHADNSRTPAIPRSPVRLLRFYLHTRAGCQHETNMLGGGWKHRFGTAE